MNPTSKELEIGQERKIEESLDLNGNSLFVWLIGTKLLKLCTAKPALSTFTTALS